MTFLLNSELTQQFCKLLNSKVHEFPYHNNLTLRTKILVTWLSDVFFVHLKSNYIYPFLKFSICTLVDNSCVIFGNQSQNLWKLNHHNIYYMPCIQAVLEAAATSGGRESLATYTWCYTWKRILGDGDSRVSKCKHWWRYFDLHLIS